jgi:hypothetical protein
VPELADPDPERGHVQERLSGGLWLSQKQAMIGRPLD